ncbi:MAG: hypothetical protein JWM53_4010, partial [bacterium]|nr:hypothetical protein [bacterium]
AETAALDVALAAIERHLVRPGAVGALFVASSAGGVYGSNFQQPLDESSAPAPISDYGRNKLVQEDKARAWAARTGTRLLIGRLANLYGPGQKLDKPQGFISQLSRCLIFHRPVHVYVPLDTRRDFLFVTDCAREVARALGLLVAGGDGVVTKIFASERTVSLARVIGIYTQLLPHHPRVICAPQPVSAQQPRALQYRSAVWREEDPRRTELDVGIVRVHAHNLALHRVGRLPPPPHGRLA